MANDGGSGENDSDNKYKDGVNKNARLIVRNISFKATEQSLKEYFSQYGTMEEVKLLKRPDGSLVGCGFVHFTHVPMANTALIATNKKQFMGRPLYVAWATPKSKFLEKDTHKIIDKILEENEKSDKILKDDPGNKARVNRNARLVVRNVSFKATEESLKKHFESYGELLEVKLLKKPDGKLVGCAFVHFKNVPMAKNALMNTNMKPFLGRPISVDWAVAKDQYMKHVVNQQLEMEEKVKKEESDSDDETPFNTSNDEVKAEIKSESGSDASDSDEDDKNSEDDDENSQSSDVDNSDVEESDEEQDVDIKDDVSETSNVPEWKRVKLNDAEDGCTVFITNIPFSIEDDQLKQFAEQTAPVKYALLCRDKLSEHSRGSGFVKFLKKEDADRFLALPKEQLKLDGQVLQVKPALKRENLQKDKKQPKDNRNLYLVKEGVIVAGTKAAEGLSGSDMNKRLTLERSKTQMLKNLNRFVSRYRLVVANIPPYIDDSKLRGICVKASPKTATVTECRVMRDLRSPVMKDGRHPSKCYGFVMFTRHEDAIACLRKLNNNPEIFDKNNRPIVSFSIEDRQALNARKKRLEKSIANNPLANKDNSTENGNAYNRKRKNNTQIDESYVKKGRFDKKGPANNKFKTDSRQQQNQFESGRFVRMPTEESTDNFTGITAKEGSQHKMRNNHKLKTQQEIHKQNLKQDKKKTMRALNLKKAAKERIKQPKQKINKKPNNKKRRPKKLNDPF